MTRNARPFAARVHRLARPLLALVAAGYIVALLISHLLGSGPESLRARVPKGVDYPTFYAGARLVWEGAGASLYDTERFRTMVRTALERPRTRLDPFYPPPVFVVMAPLGALPYRASVAAYSAAAIGLLFAGGALLRRVAPGAYAQDPRLAWLLYFGCWPVAATVLVGHPSPVLGVIAPSAALLASRRHELAVGALLGLVAYKPPLALAFGAALAFTGRWRLVLGFVLSGALLCALVTPAVGVDAWAAWAEQVRRYDENLDRLMRYPARMFNLRAGLSMPFPQAWWPAIRWPAFAASAVVLFLGGRSLAGAFDRRAPAAALRTGTFLTAIVLGSPHLYEYDAILLAVPAAAVAEVAFLPGWESRRTPLLLGLSAFLLAFPLQLLLGRVGVPVIQPVLIALLVVTQRLTREIEAAARGREPTRA